MKEDLGPKITEFLYDLRRLWIIVVWTILIMHLHNSNGSFVYFWKLEWSFNTKADDTRDNILSNVACGQLVARWPQHCPKFPCVSSA